MFHFQPQKTTPLTLSCQRGSIKRASCLALQMISCTVRFRRNSLRLESGRMFSFNISPGLGAWSLLLTSKFQGASLSYRQRNARSVWGIGPTLMVTATRRRTIPCWPRIFADHCRNSRIFQRLPGSFELSGGWLWTMGRLGWVAASWSWDVPSGNLTWLLKNCHL